MSTLTSLGSVPGTALAANAPALCWQQGVLLLHIAMQVCSSCTEGCTAATVIWSGHARAQFVAGNLTSVERRVPHPDGGEERMLRAWGTPDRSAQHATLFLPPILVFLTHRCTGHTEL